MVPRQMPNAGLTSWLQQLSSNLIPFYPPRCQPGTLKYASKRRDNVSVSVCVESTLPAVL